MRRLKYTHTAKTINSRICFSRKFSKLGIIENNDDIVVLPNFPVNQGKVIFEESLPIDNLAIKFEKGTYLKIKNLKPYKINNKEIPDEEKFSNALNSTGQLIIINIYRLIYGYISYDIDLATFSVVNFKKEMKILTALHSIQKCEKYLETLIIYNFSDYDFSFKIISILNDILKEKLKDVNIFIELMKSDLEKYVELHIDYLKDIINENFLNMRREIITDYSNPQKRTFENILLDPEFYLQCLPSIDAIILDISEIFKLFLLNRKIKGIQIAADDETNAVNEILFAIGFNDNKGKFDQNEIYNLTINNNNKTGLVLSLNTFINSNKSVSLVQKKYDNNYIFTNISSLSEGSSGAPIVNQQGKLIGMSIAYYEDNTSYDKVKETEDSLTFDKNSPIEEKSNYTKQKNSNIAISINHTIFDIFSQNLDKDYNVNEMMNKKVYKSSEIRASEIAIQMKKNNNNFYEINCERTKPANAPNKKKNQFLGNKRKFYSEEKSKNVESTKSLSCENIKSNQNDDDLKVEIFQLQK